MTEAYLGVVVLGLLHGLEPGHGWPVAALYSSRKKRPFSNALLSSSIISIAHFISSIAVVVAYVLLSSLFDEAIPYLRFAAAALLLFLAYRMWRERPAGEEETQHGHTHEETTHKLNHEHEHQHAGEPHSHLHAHARRATLSLLGLVSFAFVLGFAHEEEFALLGMAAGGVNPFMLMVLYGLSVTLALVGVTLVCVRLYRSLQDRMKRFEALAPRLAAVVLVAMAIVIAWQP